MNNSNTSDFRKRLFVQPTNSKNQSCNNCFDISDSSLSLNSEQLAYIEEIYKQNIFHQKRGYYYSRKYIESFINYLVNKYPILFSKNFECTTRIKDFRSAIRNTVKGKKLDDIFGYEFVCNTEEELNIIHDELSKYVTLTSEKKVNKSKGYKATHCYGYIENSNLNDFLSFLSIPEDAKNNCHLIDNFPLLEFQLKTYDIKHNPNISHYLYKPLLSSEKQLIISKYKSENLKPYIDIPAKWYFDDSKKKMVRMSNSEIIQYEYPFLQDSEIPL